MKTRNEFSANRLIGQFNAFSNRQSAEPRILAVDDEEPIRNLISSVLNQYGYVCETAIDAADARRRLEMERFDLVLSDIDMPGESGLDLVEFILANYEGTKAILVSVIDDIEIANKVLKNGAYDYIVKPFSKNELLINVKNALRRRDLELQSITYKNYLENAYIDKTKYYEYNVDLLNETREKLEKSELNYKSLFETMKDAVYILSEEGHFEDFNQSFMDLFGYNADEINSVHIQDLYKDKNYRKVFLSTIEKYGYVKDFNVDFVRKDGTLIRALLTASRRINSQGEAYGYQGIIRDITAQKLMEEELRKAHEDNEQLIAAITSILIGISKDYKITKWNSIAEKVFGFSASQALGRVIDELGISWEWDKIRAGVEDCACRNTDIRIEEVRFTRSDLSDAVLSISISPITPRNETCEGFLLIGADITEHILLERQLVQAQKLESIGQLAAGIAHEINTPAQYVADNTHFFNDSFKDIVALLQEYHECFQSVKNQTITEDMIKKLTKLHEEVDISYLLEEIPLAIGQTLEGVERINKIVRAMKDFSHPGSSEKVEVDINRLINSTITVSRNEWKYVAELKTEFDPRLTTVPCFPSEFNQAILNIIVNAAHAIADLSDGDPGDKGLIVIQTLQHDSWAEIRISDTGAGIPQKVRSKIFDPFFTTKEVGRGTGQGLTIAHSVIVNKHNGAISFETERGAGTTFIIRIPLSDNSVCMESM